MTAPGNPTDAYNQWSNAKKFFTSQVPGWLGSNTDDADRIRSYIFYERLYWNVPDTLQVLMRGDDEMPVYIPAARKIVEACNRFLGAGWTYLIDPTTGTPEDRAAVEAKFKKFWTDQQMTSKYARQKRVGLMRGDAVWHVTGNEDFDLGDRVHVHEVQAEQAFVILQDQNPDKIIGWHLVDLVPDPRDATKQVVRRQTYRKATGLAHGPSIITSELGIFELGQWDDRVMLANPTPKVQQILNTDFPTVQEFELPSQIDRLPVYLVPNQKQPCQTYGSSEIRGIETIIASVSQVASDQDLALALQGLGVYWTTAGPPVGRDGTPGVFDVSPGTVLEIPSGGDFGKVSGIQAGLPGIEHMNFILGEGQAALGIPDIAAGKVDVLVAESGIALQLQLNPLLSQNKERENDQADVYNHLFADLIKWWTAYEGMPKTEVLVTQKVDDPVPQDKAARFAQIIEMVTAVPPVMSVRTAQKELKAIGYDFPTDELTQLQSEAKDRATTTAAADPFNQRANAEQGGPGTPPGAPGGRVNGVPAGAGATGA